MERAAELARDSHARTRHAAVLIKDDSMLGWGTNGVPFPGEDHCYCKFGESGHHDMCRTHAEQRAITLAREGDGWRMLPGSKLIYVRLEADDSVRLEKPHFCPRCSRLALSLGVAEWIFALSEGLVGYSCADYDTISQLGWLPMPPGPPSTRHTGPTMTSKPDLLTTTRAIAAVLASAVVDDDPRLGEADQGILRVWAVMVGPVPWIAGFCQECLTGQRSPFPFTAAVPVTWRSGCRR